MTNEKLTFQYYIVSRHQGAIDWLHQRLPKNVILISHLDGQDIPSGATVVGTLPVSQIAALAKKGVRYLHLEIEIPYHLRGKELSSKQLDELGARLVPYFAMQLEEPSL